MRRCLRPAAEPLEGPLRGCGEGRVGLGADQRQREKIKRRRAGGEIALGAESDIGRRLFLIRLGVETRRLLAILHRRSRDRRRRPSHASPKRAGSPAAPPVGLETAPSDKTENGIQTSDGIVALIKWVGGKLHSRAQRGRSNVKTQSVRKSPASSCSHPPRDSRAPPPPRSYRDVRDLLAERGIVADPGEINRWVV